MKTLIEIMPTMNLFKKILDNHPEATWLTDATNFDLEYFNNYSGDKTPSPLLVRFSEHNDFKVLTDIQVNTIANIIWSRYGTKWNKIVEAMYSEYNPIDNYNMEETTKTKTRITTTQSANGTGSVYGFNSSSAVPSASSSSGGNSTTSGDAEDNVVVVTRKGNIGVTTSQQMQKSTINLWNMWNIAEQIFTDVDKVLTLPIYNY